MEKNNLMKLDIVTKILLIFLIVVVFYFIVFLILRPFLIVQPSSMSDIMAQMMGGGTRTSINLISLIIALVIGVIVSFYLFKTETKDREKDREFDIIKKVLSDDERKILNEIKKAGEITQDSLRFRLGWSKAKISTILTNLDKRELIQRERTGKTYMVHLQKH